MFPELAEGLVLSVNCGLTSRAQPKDASLAPVSGTSAGRVREEESAG